MVTGTYNPHYHGGSPDSNILDRTVGQILLGLGTPCHVPNQLRTPNPVTHEDSCKPGCGDFRVWEQLLQALLPTWVELWQVWTQG